MLDVLRSVRKSRVYVFDAVSYLMFDWDADAVALYLSFDG